MDCSTCRDTGYVCDECGQPDGECVCADGPTLVACDVCDYHDTGCDE